MLKVFTKRRDKITQTRGKNDGVVLTVL